MDRDAPRSPGIILWELLPRGRVGREIVYCSRCQSQLRGVDFDKGRALRIESQVYCSACVSKDPDLLPPELLLPDPAPADRDGGSPGPKPGSGSRVAHLGLGRRAPDAQSRPGLIGLGAAGLLIGLIVVAAALSSRPSSAPPKAQAASLPDPEPEPAARAADVPETPRRLDPEPPRKREREAGAETASLEEEVRTACAKEEFQSALGALEKARSQRPGAEGAQWIEKRAAEVHRQAEILFAPLKERALAARRRGAPEEVRAATDRVARWGVERFRVELEKALAAVAPEPAPPPAAAPASPPPVPPEGKLLAALWEAAAARAGSRDYAGAIARMEQGIPSFRDPAVRAEAAADAEALRQASALLGEALQAVSKWPRGQKVALEYLDPTGSPKRVEGSVSRAGAHRVDVHSDAETVTVEFGEILAGSLAEAVGPKAAKRSAALFCLLEGDLEGVRRHQAEVPEKYWACARRTAEARSAPKEKEARDLFFSADREEADFKTASVAVQKYQSLLKDYAETGFVARNRPSIAQRADAGREFVFLPADMAAAGGFRFWRSPKGEPSWTTDAESEPGRGPATETYLSDLAWSSATSGWGPVEKDRANGDQAAGDGKAITLNAVPYPKGLGMHAPADVKYALGGKYSVFVSDVGMDDESGPGSVLFQVWADGAMLFDSGVMRQDTATRAVSVSVAGKQELRLVVTDAGDGITNDEASWGGARLVGGALPFKGAQLDLEFSVLPDKEYRCWLYAGGCCAEALAFHVQASELVGTHPKTKESAPAEPGGEVAVPVKHNLALATRTHAGHGPRKEPARWGWVQVSLPRYAAPGPKKLRVLADQRGLWIGSAFVSAARAAPPRESELKELEKARPGEKGAGLAIANTLPKGYVWDVADAGKTQYVDRSFAFTKGPASFVGLRFLRTAHEDRSSKGNAFITFEASQAVTVVVAYDERIAARPPWLGAFTPTGEKLVTGAGTFRLFARDFPAGRVTLGGNTADGAGSGLNMYSVAVRPKGGR